MPFVIVTAFRSPRSPDRIRSERMEVIIAKGEGEASLRLLECQLIPAAVLVSGFVKDTLIMGKYLPSWQMKGELQSHQNSKLRSQQILTIQAEHVLGFLN